MVYSLSTKSFFIGKGFTEHYHSIFSTLFAFLIGAIGEDNIAENMVENTDEDVVYEGDEDGEDSVTEAVS